MREIYRSSVKASDFHPDTRTFFYNKSVIVTGGSGFVGSHIVEQLLELGARVKVLTRQQTPLNLEHIAKKIEIIIGDLSSSIDDTVRAFKNTAVVINMAAEVGGIEYNKFHSASIFQNNLQTFFNAIKAAKEVGVERFLVTSSACVYPRDCSIPTPETEGFLREPEPTNSGYGWAKRMEEYLGVQYSKEFNLSVSIARPYNAYGPRDNFNPNSSHVIPALIVKAFNTRDGTFKVWGDGSHTRSFLYVDDFARGCLEVAARYSCADPINVGTDEEISIKYLAEAIALLVSEVRGMMIKPVFDPQGITGQPRRKCDVKKIKLELDYNSKINIILGLKKTIEWYKEVYYESDFVFIDKK